MSATVGRGGWAHACRMRATAARHSPPLDGHRQISEVHIVSHGDALLQEVGCRARGGGRGSGAAVKSHSEPRQPPALTPLHRTARPLTVDPPLKLAAPHALVGPAHRGRLTATAHVRRSRRLIRSPGLRGDGALGCRRGPGVGARPRGRGAAAWPVVAWRRLHGSRHGCGSGAAGAGAGGGVSLAASGGSYEDARRSCQHPHGPATHPRRQGTADASRLSRSRRLRLQRWGGWGRFRTGRAVRQRRVNSRGFRPRSR